MLLDPEAARPSRDAGRARTDVHQNLPRDRRLECDVPSGEVLVTAYCEVDRNPPTFPTERSVHCGVRPTAASSSRCARADVPRISLLLKFVLVEPRGFEPLTSAVRLRRSPN